MVALQDPRERSVKHHESLLSHWRLAGRMNTVEEAERMVADLESRGSHAVLSMADGLCVLVEQETLRS
ncbi:hypothetical protein GC176_03955 [bacterium]|nr:hypothetical protein [bacterium]